MKTLSTPATEEFTLQVVLLRRIPGTATLYVSIEDVLGGVGNSPFPRAV